MGPVAIFRKCDVVEGFQPRDLTDRKIDERVGRIEKCQTKLNLDPPKFSL
jgi:hypothetical protein